MKAATELAIIDIGSNSIRYAEEACGALGQKRLFTTRLGTGLSRTGRLADDTASATLGVIRSLSERARQGGFTPFAYATSAVRDAENGAEFAKRIESECGVPVEILSGADEARYAFSACGAGEAGAMLDIGGASMQIASAGFKKSFRAGCVRCGDIGAQSVGLEGVRGVLDGAYACDTDPADQRLAVEIYMDREISLPAGISFGPVVGVGGTITTLAALKAGLDEFIPEEVDSVRLSQADIEGLITGLIRLGAKRREHPLLKERHDVILYGAYILSHALRLMRVPAIGVSCADGMEGYFFEIKRRLLEAVRSEQA